LGGGVHGSKLLVRKEDLSTNESIVVIGKIPVENKCPCELFLNHEDALERFWDTSANRKNTLDLHRFWLILIKTEQNIQNFDTAPPDGVLKVGHFMNVFSFLVNIFSNFF
jgi:hypothetical protein